MNCVIEGVELLGVELAFLPEIVNDLIHLVNDAPAERDQVVGVVGHRF